MFGFLDVEKARQLIADGAVVVDVRTQEEWDAGHADGSIFLPLHELAIRQSELPKDKALLMVCKSGGRSAQAAAYLCNHGLEAHNLGPWQRNPNHQN